MAAMVEGETGVETEVEVMVVEMVGVAMEVVMGEAKVVAVRVAAREVVVKVEGMEEEGMEEEMAVGAKAEEMAEAVMVGVATAAAVKEVAAKEEQKRAAHNHCSRFHMDSRLPPHQAHRLHSDHHWQYRLELPQAQ